MVSSVTQVEGDLEAITEDEERIIEQREAQKEAEVDDILRDTNVTYDGLTKREVEILSTSCKKYCILQHLILTLYFFVIFQSKSGRTASAVTTRR